MQIPNKIFEVYFDELLMDKHSNDEWLPFLVNDTIDYFISVEDYERCAILHKKFSEN